MEKSLFCEVAMSLEHFGLHGMDEFEQAIADFYARPPHKQYANQAQYRHYFRKSDFEFFRSPVAINKIHKILESTSIPLNIQVLFDAKSKNVGAESLFTRLQDEIIHPDCLNIVHTNNSAASWNYIPMTGWIMIHRAAHSLQVKFKDGEMGFNAIMAKANKTFTHLLDESHKEPYKKPEYPVETKKIFHGIFDKLPDELITLLMTTRSARTINLFGELETLGELMAQYVVTGKITLLRHHQLQERFQAIVDRTNVTSPYTFNLELNGKFLTNTRNFIDGGYLHWVDAIYHRLMTRDSKFVDQVIEEFEHDLNVYMKQLFQFCVGKTLRF
jgi:hypothetical protein